MNKFELQFARVKYMNPSFIRLEEEAFCLKQANLFHQIVYEFSVKSAHQCLPLYDLAGKAVAEDNLECKTATQSKDHWLYNID